MAFVKSSDNCVVAVVRSSRLHSQRARREEDESRGQVTGQICTIVDRKWIIGRRATTAGGNTQRLTDLSIRTIDPSNEQVDYGGRTELHTS